jgi:hypothetical protein
LEQPLDKDCLFRIVFHMVSVAFRMVDTIETTLVDEK